MPDEAAPAIEDSIGGALQVAASLPDQVAGAVTAAARDAFVDGLHITAFTAASLLLGVAVAAWFALRGVPKVIDDEPEAPDGDGDGQPDAPKTLHA